MNGIIKKRGKDIVRLFLIFSALLAVLLLYHYNKRMTAFTPEKWNRYAWNDRQLLIRDFIKQYDLNEMTRSEIILLLGEEPEIYEGYAVPNRAENRLVYDFGQIQHRIPLIPFKTFRSFANITFIITFDSQERVLHYRLTTYRW